MNIKCVFWFSLQHLLEVFLILRRIQQDTDLNVQRYSLKYLLFLPDFSETWIFSTYLEKYLNIK
jgi:hypothetical protein